MTQDSKIQEPKPPRGFALLSREERTLLARRGGIAAQAKGHAHRLTSEEASIAGKKGGSIVSMDRAHMAAIGRKGGASKNRKPRKVVFKRVACSETETSGPETADDVTRTPDAVFSEPSSR